jgi:hypothetical protein
MKLYPVDLLLLRIAVFMDILIICNFLALIPIQPLVQTIECFRWLDLGLLLQTAIFVVACAPGDD